MRSLIKITLLCLLLSACSFIGYQPDVQQGNLIFPEAVDKLKPGMSVEQVANIMGTPILVDTFSNNRWDYVYTLKRSHHSMELKRVVVHFANGRVAQVDKDLVC